MLIAQRPTLTEEVVVEVGLKSEGLIPRDEITPNVTMVTL